MDTYNFTLELKVGEDEWREDDFEVTVTDFEPYDPGQVTGPPENCYPPEGGCASGGDPVTWTKEGEKKGSVITWAAFVKIYAASKGIANLSDAEKKIDEELYQAIVDEEPDYDGPDDDWD